MGSINLDGRRPRRVPNLGTACEVRIDTRSRLCSVVTGQKLLVRAASTSKWGQRAVDTIKCFDAKTVQNARLRTKPGMHL